MTIVCLLAATASADKPASLAHYEKGKKAYAAGKFELAAREFEAAYAQWSTPEYLHDIGQAYRRMERCTEAATSFEKYLAAKPDATNRVGVSELVAQLRTKCPAQPQLQPQPQPQPPPQPQPHIQLQAQPATSAATSSGAESTTAPTSLATSSVAATAAPHSPWHPAASAGIVMLDAGPVVMPPLPDVSVGVLRDVPLELPVGLQVGANLGIARLPFDDVMTGTVWLAGPELVALASRPLASRIALIGGVGAGAQLVAGLDAGNPFTTNGAAHASFVMLRLRGELGVAFRASERFSVRVAPGYQYSPRRPPLAADIPSLHGFALHAGVTVDL